MLTLKDIIDRVGNKGAIQYTPNGNEYDEDGNLLPVTGATLLSIKYSSKMLSILELEKLSLKDIAYRIQFFANNIVLKDNIKGGIFTDTIGDKYTIRDINKLGFYGKVVLYSMIVEKR